MRISLMHYLQDSQRGSPIDDFVDDLRRLSDEGFDTVWTPQLPWEPDTMIALAVALRELDGLTVGTAVLPIQVRHPMVLAQSALTLSMLSGGRFRLGIGVTHPSVSEQMWGIGWNRPVRRLGEYLDGLLPLLAGEQASADGELTTTRGQLDIPASAPPVYVAALGPQLLRVAGRRTAGTITVMTGPKTLAGHIVPTLTTAAAEAGRTAEVVAAFPICVTDDVAATRARAAEAYAVYGQMPSYRAMLDREGLTDPADIALIGDEPTVATRLDELAAAGVDEFAAHVFGLTDEDRTRTRTYLRGRN